MVKDVIDFLIQQDPQVGNAVKAEYDRQRRNIELIASENFVSEAVLAAASSVLTNKYAEGYPGKRYYGGCECVDVVENIARDRAKAFFGADHVNVQPHSGASANYAVYQALCNVGDTVLGMNLDNGGHLTHGSPVNFSGLNYNIVPYGVDPKTHRIDYDQVRDLAKQHKPKMIIAGASAYPRIIDFKAFREIADEVGAYLFVDMAHIAGLVAAGLHPSPVPYADVVTTTTHKTLRGPRGGVILCKEEHAKKIDKAIFPGSQGGPLMHIITAKAVAFGEAMKPEFKTYQERQGPGPEPDGRRLPAGLRRHGQPPDAGGPPPGQHHRQGDGEAPGPGEHHRQQEHHPRRSPVPLRYQRHPGGRSRRHQPRPAGGGHEGHRPAHLEDRHGVRHQAGRDPRRRGRNHRQVPPLRVSLYTETLC